MAEDSKVEKAFHEVFHNVPENVKKTGKTGEAKRKMLIAISLSKARQAGAKIPKKKSDYSHAYAARKQGE